MLALPLPQGCFDWHVIHSKLEAEEAGPSTASVLDRLTFPFIELPKEPPEEEELPPVVRHP